MYSISTGSGVLGKHLKDKHPEYENQGSYNRTPQTALQVRSSGSSPQIVGLDPDMLNLLLLKWLIGASFSPFEFQNGDLLAAFKYLNPAVSLWSKENAQAITVKIYNIMKVEVESMLEQVNSKISVAIEFWNSYEDLFYMGMTCKWIDENWVMHRVLLDIVRIPHPCTGTEIFSAIVKVFQMYGIEKRIICCTIDGSIEAFHACEALKEKFNGEKTQFWFIPCVGKTINTLIEDGVSSLKPLLSKIREFAVVVNTNHEILSEFKKSIVMHQEGLLEFPLDICASWNADFTMLDIVCKAPKSMENIIKRHKTAFNTQNLPLSRTEKTIINTVHPFLESFHKVTTHLSRCENPTVGLLLFLLDHVVELINSGGGSSQHEWKKTICDDMAKSAQNIPTQLHALFTFIASILDPRIRKSLLPDALVFDRYFDEAKVQFMENYDAKEVASLAEEAEEVSYIEAVVKRKRRGNATAGFDELSQYISEASLGMDTDILDWWKRNSSRYPRLSSMARDYLAVQATHVELDELYSSKRCDILRQKFNLSWENGAALMCIKSWVADGLSLESAYEELGFDKFVASTPDQ